MDYILITGATSGIGEQFASLYGSQKKNLILVGRNQSKLDIIKKQIEGLHKVIVLIVLVDLADDQAVGKIGALLKNNELNITLVINNAGIATAGGAHLIPSCQDYQMVMVNIVSLMEITKLFLDYFYGKNGGGILNVASTGAYGPGPYTASYFASKSFVLNYSKAVNYEARSKGVYVGVLCPGTTRTNLFSASKQKCPRWAMDPAKVAKIGARQIQRQKAVQICGWGNVLLTVLPERIKMAGIARIKQPDK